LWFSFFSFFIFSFFILNFSLPSQRMSEPATKRQKGEDQPGFHADQDDDDDNELLERRRPSKLQKIFSILSPQFFFLTASSLDMDRRTPQVSLPKSSMVTYGFPLWLQYKEDLWRIALAS